MTWLHWLSLKVIGIRWDRTTMEHINLFTYQWLLKNKSTTVAENTWDFFCIEKLGMCCIFSVSSLDLCIFLYSIAEKEQHVLNWVVNHQLHYILFNILLCKPNGLNTHYVWIKKCVINIFIRQLVLMDFVTWYTRFTCVLLVRKHVKQV